MAPKPVSEIAGFNGGEEDDYELPVNLALRDDLLMIERAANVINNDTPVAQMIANAHRFVIRGGTINDESVKVMSYMHVALTKVKAPSGELLGEHFNDCDVVNVELCDQDEDGGKIADWNIKRNARGSFTIGCEDVHASYYEAYNKYRLDKGAILKVIGALLCTVAIMLFKVNHHFTDDETARIVKILEGCGADVVLSALGLKYSSAKYIVKFVRVLLHPVNMKHKWAIACKLGTDVVFRCRMTGMGSGNAKAGVILAVIDRCRKDVAVDVFLGNMEINDKIDKLLALTEGKDEPTTAVKFCTNSGSLAGVPFVNCETVAKEFDPDIIMGCVLYIGGSLADQKTFSDEDYSVSRATAIKKGLQDLAKALSGEDSKDAMFILKVLVETIKSYQDESEVSIKATKKVAMDQLLVKKVTSHLDMIS